MKKKNNSTYRRKTYKNRKRNTYKKRKNKTKRRRRNLKGGTSLRERATSKVNNMKKRGTEFWGKHGDTIKKSTMNATKVGAFGVAAHTALAQLSRLRRESLEKNEDKKKKKKTKNEKEEVDADVTATAVNTAALSSGYNDAMLSTAAEVVPTVTAPSTVSITLPPVPTPAVPESAPVKTEEERGRAAYSAYEAEVERSVNLHDELILLGDDALWWRANADGVDKDKIASAHTRSGKVKRATMVDLIMSLPPSKWTGAGAP
jgi:hypothetical protein